MEAFDCILYSLLFKNVYVHNDLLSPIYKMAFFNNRSLYISMIVLVASVKEVNVLACLQHSQYLVIE